MVRPRCSESRDAGHLRRPGGGPGAGTGSAAIMRPAMLSDGAAGDDLVSACTWSATQPKRLLIVGLAVGVSLVIAPLVALGLHLVAGSGPAVRPPLRSSMPAPSRRRSSHWSTWRDFVTGAVVLSMLSPFTLTPLIGICDDGGSAFDPRTDTRRPRQARPRSCRSADRCTESIRRARTLPPWKRPRIPPLDA